MDDYLKNQKRFKHLLNNDATKDELALIQAKADANIEKYGLMD